MQVLRILKRFSFKFDQNSYDKITQVSSFILDKSLIASHHKLGVSLKA
jgi:hypothetical protein